MTVTSQPVQTPSVPMAAVNTIPDSSSTSLWGLPVESQRLRRKPANVWIKGNKGFRVGRRKTGPRQKKRIVKMTKADYINSQKMNVRNGGGKPKMMNPEGKIMVPVRLSIPKKGENTKKFIDFGNSWKHSEDGYNMQSVKVKRKKDALKALPRKGKQLKSHKSKDRNHGQIGAANSYRVKNEDGSITWGYVSSDGSYKVGMILNRADLIIHIFRRKLSAWTV